MTFHVAITYYNRPDMLAALIGDIQREKAGHTVSVYVYDDCSDHPVPADAMKHIKEVYRFREHGGKKMYYRSIRQALNVAEHDQSWDYLIVMQDDDRLAPRFFNRAANTWEALREHDSAARACNLWLDEQRKDETVWTAFERVLCETSAGPIWKTQWTEPTFTTDRRIFAALGTIPTISPGRWRTNSTLSSGVGEIISQRLHRQGFTIYQVAESLLYHGDHPSLMNPIARGERQLTSAWWPGKDAA